MRTVTIIYFIVCAAIDVIVAGAFGYAVWTDHRARKTRNTK